MALKPALPEIWEFNVRVSGSDFGFRSGFGFGFRVRVSGPEPEPETHTSLEGTVRPEFRNPKFETRSTKPETRIPKPETRFFGNLKPGALTPNPDTPNPEPQNPYQAEKGRCDDVGEQGHQDVNPKSQTLNLKPLTLNPQP